MSELKICRICLNNNVKMFKLEYGNLKHYYEQITRSKIQSKDDLPRWFCFECAAFLRKYHKFKEKCDHGQTTLRNLKAKGFMTYYVVEDIRKNRVDLHSTLDLINYISTKRVRTYTVKHKVEPLPLEMEKIIVNPFTEEENLKFEFTPEPNTEIIKEEFDDETPNDRTEEVSQNPVFPNDVPTNPVPNPVLIDPVFPAPSTDYPHANTVYPPANPVYPPTNPVYPSTNPVYPPANQVYPPVDPVYPPIDPVYPPTNPIYPPNPEITSTTNDDDKLLKELLFDKDDSDSGSNFSMDVDIDKYSEDEEPLRKVIRRPRRNVKQIVKPEATKKEPKKGAKKDKDVSEPEKRRFEIKEPKHKLSKDNWEIQVLKDDEALERFKQKEFDSKYVRSDFKCEKCYKGFSKHDMLMRHNTMWHEKPYQHSCRFCHMQFKWKNKVTRHMMEHYYIYKCLRCNLQCNREHGAQFHEDYHNGKIHKCKHCGEEYTHISTYYTHLRTSHRNSHVCKLCGASFVSDAGLNSHMRRKHCHEPLDVFEESGTANNIYCQKCDVSFVSQAAYNEHLTQTKQHEEENNKFKRGRRKRREILANSAKCHHCDKEFKSKTECKEHVATEHPNKNKAERVVCEVCGAVLSSAYIDIHMNRHTRKKVYPCQTCGKEFLCATSHNTHQLTHSGEKPFPCPSCPKRFGLKGHMDIHYKRIHLKEPYPKSGPTLCPVCSKPFPSKANMDVHYRRVHLKEPYPKSGPKPCPVCAKNFPSRAHMNEHYRRVHLKEPYPKRTYNRKKNNQRQPDEVPLSNLFQQKMMHHLNQ